MAPRAPWPARRNRPTARRSFFATTVFGSGPALGGATQSGAEIVRSVTEPAKRSLTSNPRKNRRFVETGISPSVAAGLPARFQVGPVRIEDRRHGAASPPGGRRNPGELGGHRLAVEPEGPGHARDEAPPLAKHLTSACRSGFDADNAKLGRHEGQKAARHSALRGEPRRDDAPTGDRPGATRSAEEPSSPGVDSSCDLTRALQAKKLGPRPAPGLPRPSGQVAVTNNGCERALRPAVVQRKVTNGYPVMWAAAGEADVRTVVDTARLAGAGIFATILKSTRA